MFRWREELSGSRVRFAISDRLGGVSVSPYASLNLATHVGDDPAAVAENRRRVGTATGAGPDSLLILEQVHGRDVVLVETPGGAPPPIADAAVTVRRGVVLTVLVADCTPVLVADPEAEVVGVAHAGRRGMASGIVASLLEAMQAAGARRLIARVGPSICPRCYEVPRSLREAVSRDVPVARSVTWTGTPSLDVAAGVVEQLTGSCDEIRWLPGCTREDLSLFSARRDASTGRFAGLAWIEP